MLTYSNDHGGHRHEELGVLGDFVEESTENETQTEIAQVAQHEPERNHRIVYVQIDLEVLERGPDHFIIQTERDPRHNKKRRFHHSIVHCVQI